MYKARFGRAWRDELCTRLKTCGAWPATNRSKRRVQSKAKFIEFWSKNFTPSFSLFKLTEIKVETSFDRVKTNVVEINYKTYYVVIFLTFWNSITTRITSKLIWQHVINSDFIETSAFISRFKRLEISLHICLGELSLSFLTFSTKTSVYLQTHIPLSVKSKQSLFTQPNHLATN